MIQNHSLFSSIHSLSEAEKLELFKIEELEFRLEMAAVSTDSNNGSCTKGDVTINEACW